MKGNYDLIVYKTDNVQDLIMYCFNSNEISWINFPTKSLNYLNVFAKLKDS